LRTNIFLYSGTISSFNDDTSFYFGFNKVYHALLSFGNKSINIPYIKLQRTNLMLLYDVEKDNTLILTRLISVVTLPPTMHSCNMEVATLVRIAESMHCSG